jgi:hypothetical protein
VPRSAHADWKLSPDRPDPLELLEAQGSTRVPELVPIRYGRMRLSPFAFFCGAACVMAPDLAPLPRTSLRVELSGDAQPHGDARLREDAVGRHRRPTA